MCSTGSPALPEHRDPLLDRFLQRVDPGAWERDLPAAPPAPQQWEPAGLAERDAVQLAGLVRDQQAAIAALQGRVRELEGRLQQREEHIGSLTRSLIDMGQLTARLQAGVREIVNTPPAAPPELPPACAEAASMQRRVRGLDEANAQREARLLEAMEKVVRSPQRAGEAVPSVGEVLAALEEHRDRAREIAELNRRSLPLLRAAAFAPAPAAEPAAPPAPLPPPPQPHKSPRPPPLERPLPPPPPAGPPAEERGVSPRRGAGLALLHLSSPRSRARGISLLRAAQLPLEIVPHAGVELLRLSSPRARMRGLSLLRQAGIEPQEVPDTVSG
eukprot:TRINITY_DN8872_c2_g1_i1.p3 TRINITY_DN8872_c2_g1~~TRINITY_DN8872_c2_g1_i1.p3  ORF type:complete len:360 (+),score=128.17 TRINITY_DN8872_c2_g1_i1:93-1082(+)